LTHLSGTIIVNSNSRLPHLKFASTFNGNLSVGAEVKPNIRDSGIILKVKVLTDDNGGSSSTLSVIVGHQLDVSSH
jgi:hypothetical protein